MRYLRNLWHKFFTPINISYLFINIGNIPIMTIVSSFLAIYYVNVLKMDEYAVGTMFLIARIFDGINDPLIGGIIDRIKGDKLQKFKRVLILGTIICSINYMILWLGPALVSENFKLLIAYISYLLLGVTFPIMDISLNSLLPVLAKQKEEREILSSIKIIGYGLGTVIIEFFVPLFLSRFGHTIKTYWGIVILSTLFIIVFSVGGAIGIKNDKNVFQVKVNEKKNQQNIIGSFLKIFFEKNVLCTFFSGLCFYTGNAALVIANTYYTTYYLGDVKYLTYVTIATYSLEMFVILLIPVLTKKIETRIIFSSGLVMAGMGLLIRFYPWKTFDSILCSLLISSAIYGIGYGFVMILFYSIQAENVDRVYIQYDIQAESSIAAIMSMVNKLGKGIGGALPLYILGKMKVNDTTYSKYSLRLIASFVPALLFLVGGILFMILYDKDLRQKVVKK